MEQFAEQIEYIQSLRARCIRITVKPGPRIRVTVPRYGSRRQAEEFVRQKADWIHKTIRRLAQTRPVSESGLRQEPVITDQMIAQQGILFERLQALAARHGFRYRNAAIRNQKTRWGSCSSANNINLNIHLLNLPEHLRDYVILHELVHTEHKNHSKHFWARLDEITGGASRVLRKEMRKYRIIG